MQTFVPSGAKRQRREEAGVIPQVDGAADRVTLPFQSEQAKVSVPLHLQLSQLWSHMSEPFSRIHAYEQRLKEWELLKEAYMDAASLRETGAAIPQLDGEDDDEASEVSDVMCGWDL